MPQFWKSKLWELQSQIAEQEGEIRKLQYGEWQWPGREPIEPSKEPPVEPRERAPIGWPWEWLGITARRWEKPREEGMPGAMAMYGLAPTELPEERRIKEFEEYRALPLTKQLGYEAPFWTATAFVPTFTAMRAGLAGKAGIAPKAARAALLPVAAIEQAPVKAIEKIAKVIKPKGVPVKLTNELPFRTPELTPYKARKQIKLVANELTEHLGIPPTKPIPVITQATMKQNVWNRIGEKIGGFVNRTYRVENILLRGDKYTDGGKMWQAIWKPVEEATNRQVGRLYNRYTLFMRFLQKNNLDLGKLVNQTVEIDGIKLSTFERIGIYRHSLNPDNLVHVVFGNNIPAKTITKIVDSLTPEEKILANFWAKYYTGQTPIMQATYKQVTGKAMAGVENYSPIQLQRKAMEMLDFNEFVISEAQLRGAAKWASARIRKGFTLPRTGKAMQPVELDALNIWLKHLEGVEHYKAFAPVIRDLQRLMANGQFRYAITNSQGRQVPRVLDQWLKDIAMTNPLAPRNQFEAFARTMRVNAVTAVLGLNILTAMKQFPSYFAGMAEVGTMPVIRGLSTFLRHPDQTMKLLRQYAPQIYKRRFEREIAEAAAMRGLKAIVAGKMSPRQVFMIMTTSMDRLAVNSIWRGGFDDALRKGMATKEAAEYATRAIRRTQPFFGIKDVPEYWRSGELAKALTIFTNQLNQYWNYYRFHIIGKKLAGKISNYEVAKRIIETFVIPALTIGAITRSRPAQDVREFATDLTSMGLATVPIFGSWVVSGIRGFTSSGLITTEVLDEIRRLAYQVNQEAWDGVAKTLPIVAGYAAGIPVAQPRRFLQGIWDMASGKTDDWMELIWGAYTRGAVEREEELEWPEMPVLPEGEMPKKAEGREWQWPAE